MNPNFIFMEKWQSLLPRYETWRNSKIFPQKWSSERWQSLHLIHVQKILVCAVNVHHSFPSLHTYDFKAASYWSCSSRHELTWSPCSALITSPPVQLHVMHTELTSATASQWGGCPPDLIFSVLRYKCVHFSFIFILPQSGQFWEPGVTLDIASDTRTGIRM